VCAVLLAGSAVIVLGSVTALVLARHKPEVAGKEPIHWAPVSPQLMLPRAPATRETPPWEVKRTAKNKRGPGEIPAWVIRPPPPDPQPKPLPTPHEPPDPRTYRAPMHNPGGVNGARPPRVIVGLDR
jgi:hypothetical protein